MDACTNVAMNWAMLNPVAQGNIRAWSGQVARHNSHSVCALPSGSIWVQFGSNFSTYSALFFISTYDYYVLYLILSCIRLPFKKLSSSV